MVIAVIGAEKRGDNHIFREIGSRLSGGYSACTPPPHKTTKYRDRDMVGSMTTVRMSECSPRASGRIRRESDLILVVFGDVTWG